MQIMAWYNKYRPTTFDELVGQDLLKKILQRTIQEGKIKHAYLFTGTRGAGKTTTARLFANAVNETDKNPQAALDIIEMDAASNTGVDNIRNLQESATTPPIAGKYKFYILDEAHMLSKNAWNALLKTLEEPPEYLVFILVTTDPEKILPTIHSRVTRIDLGFHTEKDILTRLKYIAQKENLKIEEKALQILAKKANGSQRDGVTFLETVASYNFENIDESSVNSVLGLASEEILEQSFDFFLNKDLQKLQEIATNFEKQNIKFESFLHQFLDFIIQKNFQNNFQYSDLVLAVTNFLEKKINLNTVQLVFGVILAELKLMQNNLQTQTLNLVQNEELKPQNNLEKKVENHGLNLNNINYEDGQNKSENVKKIVENEAKSGQKFESKNDILQQVKKMPKCPPILKMCGDLQVKMQDKKLFIFTKNAYCQSACTNEKTSNLILESFNECGLNLSVLKVIKTGEEFAQIEEDLPIKKEEVLNRAVKNEEKQVEKTLNGASQFLQIMNKKQENFESVEDEKKENTVTNEEEKNEKKTDFDTNLQEENIDLDLSKLAEHKSGEIFYETYLRTKGNLQEKGVAIYEEKIRFPKDEEKQGVKNAGEIMSDKEEYANMAKGLLGEF